VLYTEAHLCYLRTAVIAAHTGATLLTSPNYAALTPDQPVQF